MNMWLKESNRQYHLLYAIPLSFLFTILFGLGVAVGLEFKDVQSKNTGINIFKYSWKNWDWLDIAATAIGSAIGQILQLIFILIICG